MIWIIVMWCQLAFAFWCGTIAAYKITESASLNTCLGYLLCCLIWWPRLAYHLIKDD